jgi:hypothetical protein
MRHGKGRLPPWIEVRRVVNGAIEEGLNTHSVDELLDIIRQPCREAGLKAARNKSDKDAQLKREYHNMAMDLLWRTWILVNRKETGFPADWWVEAHLIQAEQRRVKEECARDVKNMDSVDHGRFDGAGVDRTNRVNTTSGRGTQQPKTPRKASSTKGIA